MSDDRARRLGSDAEARATLSDVGYLVWCMTAGFKHFLALAAKRWPEVRL